MVEQSAPQAGARAPLLGLAYRALTRATEVVAGALLVVMSVVVILQVVYRYFLQTPIAWSVEVATFTFIWCSVLSAAIGVRYRANFALEALVKRAPASAQRALVLVTSAGISWLLLVLVYFGFSLVEQNRTQISPALGIPMSLPYLSVPVGGALMFVFLWANVLEDWRR